MNSRNPYRKYINGSEKTKMLSFTGKMYSLIVNNIVFKKYIVLSVFLPYPWHDTHIYFIFSRYWQHLYTFIYYIPGHYAIASQWEYVLQGLPTVGVSEYMKIVVCEVKIMYKNSRAYREDKQQRPNTAFWKYRGLWK